MITIKSNGSFRKTHKFFRSIGNFQTLLKLREYGARGVEALRESTPKDSGETANAWSYGVDRKNGSYTLYWQNSHTNDGINIAIVLQYGHATSGGCYVQGRDYINPAVRPIFDEIADSIWKEAKGQ